MIRDKEVQDRKSRPVLDKSAAGRFIRHNLHERKPTDKELLAPKNRKRKIDEIWMKSIENYAYAIVAM